MDLPPKTTKHLFDELPLEVIREVIFPFLDFETKISVNRSLPIQDRIAKKMTRKFIEAHDGMVSVNNFQSRLRCINAIRTVDTKTRNKRANMVIRMMEEFHTNRHVLLVRNSPNFTSTLINKLKEFVNEIGHVLFLNAYYRKRLVDACKTALATIESMV